MSTGGLDKSFKYARLSSGSGFLIIKQSAAISFIFFAIKNHEKGGWDLMLPPGVSPASLQNKEWCKIPRGLGNIRLEGEEKNKLLMKVNLSNGSKLLNLKSNANRGIMPA